MNTIIHRKPDSEPDKGTNIVKRTEAQQSKLAEGVDGRDERRKDRKDRRLKAREDKRANKKDEKGE